MGRVTRAAVPAPEGVKLTEGAPIQITGVLTDISRRRQLEQQLLSTGRLDALQNAAARLAHDLNNPLMIIKAALHTLRRPAVTSDELREVAADIDEEVVRLNHVVNDVLDFARADALRAEIAAAGWVMKDRKDGWDLEPAAL